MDPSMYDASSVLTAPSFDPISAPLILSPASSYNPIDTTMISANPVLSAPSAFTPSAPPSSSWQTSLSALASFGGSIASAVGTAYRSVNPTPRVNSNLPSSSFLGTSTVPGAVNFSQILLLAIVGIAIVLGFKHLRK